MNTKTFPPLPGLQQKEQCDLKVSCGKSKKETHTLVSIWRKASSSFLENDSRTHTAQKRILCASENEEFSKNSMGHKNHFLPAIVLESEDERVNKRQHCITAKQCHVESNDTSKQDSGDPVLNQQLCTEKCSSRNSFETSKPNTTNTFRSHEGNSRIGSIVNETVEVHHSSRLDSNKEDLQKRSPLLYTLNSGMGETERRTPLRSNSSVQRQSSLYNYPTFNKGPTMNFSNPLRQIKDPWVTSRSTLPQWLEDVASPKSTTSVEFDATHRQIEIFPIGAQLDHCHEDPLDNTHREKKTSYEVKISNQNIEIENSLKIRNIKECTSPAIDNSTIVQERGRESSKVLEEGFVTPKNTPPIVFGLSSSSSSSSSSPSAYKSTAMQHKLQRVSPYWYEKKSSPSVSLSNNRSDSSMDSSRYCELNCHKKDNHCQEEKLTGLSSILHDARNPLKNQTALNHIKKRHQSLGLPSFDRKELEWIFQRPKSDSELPKFIIRLRERLTTVERRITFLQNERRALSSILWKISEEYPQHLQYISTSVTDSTLNTKKKNNSTTSNEKFYINKPNENKRSPILTPSNRYSDTSNLHSNDEQINITAMESQNVIEKDKIKINNIKNSERLDSGIRYDQLDLFDTITNEDTTHVWNATQKRGPIKINTISNLILEQIINNTNDSSLLQPIETETMYSPVAMDDLDLQDDPSSTDLLLMGEYGTEKIDDHNEIWIDNNFLIDERFTEQNVTENKSLSFFAKLALQKQEEELKRISPITGQMLSVDVIEEQQRKSSKPSNFNSDWINEVTQKCESPTEQKKREPSETRFTAEYWEKLNTDHLRKWMKFFGMKSSQRCMTRPIMIRELSKISSFLLEESV